MAHVARRTVVVLLNGGVVSLEDWHDEVDAVVEAWLPGQAGGGAIADVLTGRVNPSGGAEGTLAGGDQFVHRAGGAALPDAADLRDEVAREGGRSDLGEVGAA